MTNAEWLLEKKIPFKDITACKDKGGEYWIIFCGIADIGRIKAEGKTDEKTGQVIESGYAAVLRWLDSEYRKPLLDSGDKQFIKDFVKLFGGKFVSLSYCSSLSALTYTDGAKEHRVFFPTPVGRFNRLTIRNDYTAEELGL